MYQTMFNKNNAKIFEIENATAEAETRYLNFINNIAGNDQRATQYIKTIANI